MKRKFVLLLGTFLLLLLAFGTYQLFVPGAALSNPQTRRIRPPANFGQAGDGAEVGVVRGVTFKDRTLDGQLRGIYKVSSWTKADDGSYILENPQAEVRQKNGTRAYMSARRARIQAEEVADGLNVREGTMEGNVEIFFDQSTDKLQRLHPRDRTYDQRRRQCIQIKLDDIQFSQDMLEITSDSKVYLWSRTVDLIGKGLTLKWNEDPRELRLLRIDHGEIMIVKELPEQVDMIQLPTEDAADEPLARTEPPPRTQPTSAPAKPTELTSAKADAPPPSTQPTTQPAEQTQPQQPQNVRDAWALGDDDLSPTPPRSAPSSRPDDEKSSVTLVREGSTPTTQASVDLSAVQKDRPARNIYQATFTRDVRVHSGQRKLTGADDLALLFEWDRAWRQDEAGEGEASSTQPASAPAAATTQPNDTEPLAATQPATDTPEDPTRQMEIYWEGPLEIVPKGTTPRPSRRRYTIAGTGPQVVLTDLEARVICRDFSFQNPQQEAVFRGSEDQPVLLQLVRGDEILCNREMRFNRARGKARLDGGGRMRRYLRSEAISSWADLPIEMADPRAIGEEVTWVDRVETTFLNRRIRLDDGSEVTRPYVDAAKFYGDVVMKQFAPPSPAGEQGPVESFVKCDELDIALKTTSGGRIYPTRAEARGNVSARQQGSDIQAGLARVRFRPRDEDHSATRPASSDRSLLADTGGTRVEPTNLFAEHDVEITYHDPAEPDDPPLHIQAQTVDANLLRQVALLTGTPAIIQQGSNRIIGETINFDENAEAAKVTGPGRLEFTTDQDLSGNRLAEPRPVRIAWSNWMLYHGSSGQGIFDGDVDLRAGGNFDVQDAADTGGEWLTCGQMRLFMETPKQAALRKDTAPRPQSRSLGMGVDRYSSRQMLQVEAEGGKGEDQLVKLQSRSPHPDNPAWLQRRIELRGRKVIYDARSGNSKIDGRGSFLAEDYRLPEQRRTTSPGGIGGRLDRPSQTLFTWTKSLFLSQKDRRVHLKGKATMVHRSGNKLLKVPGLKVQPFGELSTGRLSKLRSETLDVWFEDPNAGRKPDDIDTLSARTGEEPPKPERQQRQMDPFEAGPQIGALRMFYAAGSVSFQDEPKTMNRIVDAQRILSDQAKRVMTIWGYPQNATNRTNAAMVIEDTATGRVQRYESPTFTIRNYGLPNEVIQIEKLQGGGGM